MLAKDVSKDGKARKIGQVYGSNIPI